MIVASSSGQRIDASTAERPAGPRGIELLTLDDGLVREWDAVPHAWTEQ